MRCGFVEDHPQYPVELVLRVLGIASSTFRCRPSMPGARAGHPSALVRIHQVNAGSTRLVVQIRVQSAFGVGVLPGVGIMVSTCTGSPASTSR